MTGSLRLDAGPVDYVLIAIYFVFVLGIGLLARRGVSSSIDFFLSGRSLPAWVTGLAFVSANLGAVEIMGMSANGAQFGMVGMHYFWIGAVPAILFLGIVMMPFFYGSQVRSVPEYMLHRFGVGAHLVNATGFAVAQVLIAGVNLYLLGTIVNVLLGWPLWVSVIAAAAIVLCYITLGGLSAAIYNEVLQFFVIVAALLPLTIVGLHQVGGWQDCKTRYPPDRCHPGPAMNSADSLTTCSLSSASCSVSGSCSHSATGPPILLRYNAHSPPSHCPPHGAPRSSAPSRRCSYPSSW